MIVLLGLAGMAVVSFYVYALSRNVYLGWVSLLAVHLFNYTFGVSQSNIGGTNLDPIDIVGICLLIAGIVRTIPRFLQPNTARTISLGYFVVFAFSLARGVLANGFKGAATESRGYVGFLIAILYFLTAPVDSAAIQKYVKTYFYYGIGLCIVALFAYAGFHVGAAAWAHDADVGVGSAIDGRLLPSAAAAALALCFFLSLAWTRYQSRNIWLRWLPAITLGLAIFLRHRTVWAMLAVGISALFLLDGRLFRRVVPIAVLGILVTIGFSLVSRESVGVDEDKFSSSSSNDGTILWRIHSWEALVYDEDQTPFTLIFGKAMGSGYWRFEPEAGTYINAPPHSEYVAQYSRVGLFGVAILLWSFVRPLRKFWALSSRDLLAVEPSASAWALVIIGILIYGVTYGIEADAYALLGLACAIVADFDSAAYLQEDPDEVDNLLTEAVAA